ncbi:MAG: RNA methyltransferase [Pseudomonadota bacterium]|nr:RNA methyltransferase [Pseudomonadota bacterium]
MKFSITGFGHLREYLLHRPQAVVSATCTARQHQKLPTDVRALVRIGATAGAEIQLTPLRENELDAALHSGKLQTLVALDHISDPRNLGAVVRAAAFFGIEGVIIADRRQAQLTATVVATAHGGLACVNLYVVKNISRVLAKLKGFDFWVIGADVRGEPLQFCDFSKKVYLFGSEDKGISPLLRGHCDCLFRIPSSGGKAIESLNIASAAAVMLFWGTNAGGSS